VRRLAALILSIILMLSVVTVYPSIEADAAENKETVVEFYVSANGKDREKGTDEPEYWDIRKAMADTSAKDSLLNFSYYDSEGRSIYIR